MRSERHNWKIVASNMAEAREEIERLEKLIADKCISREEFEIGLRHAFHHLNFAWNIRHMPTKRYTNLTQEDFEAWGQHPEEMKQL